MIDYKISIDEIVKDIGFSAYGITQAGTLDSKIIDKKIKAKEITSFESEDLNLRLNPQAYLSGAKTIIVFALSYYWKLRSPKRPKYPLSIYTRGLDYHQVMGKKIREFDLRLKTKIKFRSKIHIDSGPLLEKVLGQRAGLGNFGKNTILINKDFGTYFFLGLHISDLDLDQNQYKDQDQRDICKSCDKCIKACPTSALLGDGTMDPNRCLSYLSQIKEERTNTKDLNLVYGCDICQRVCPYNKTIKTNVHQEFRPVIYGLPDQVKTMSNRAFKRTYKDFAFAWSGREVLVRNMEVLDG